MSNRKGNDGLNLTQSMRGTKLPFNVAPIDKDHPFRLAMQRHLEAGQILEALINIESCRVDALARSKEVLAGTDEHSEVMAALAILSSKRAEAKKRYHQYYSEAIKAIKAI